jgi:hypothetical protein
MIKSLAPLAIFALLGASVIAWPMFAPEVKAKEALALTKQTPALGKANQPAVDPVVRDCSSQVWPDFDISCLRESGSGNRVQQARLVTARR